MHRLVTAFADVVAVIVDSLYSCGVFSFECSLPFVPDFFAIPRFTKKVLLHRFATIVNLSNYLLIFSGPFSSCRSRGV